MNRAEIVALSSAVQQRMQEEIKSFDQMIYNDQGRPRAANSIIQKMRQPLQIRKYDSKIIYQEFTFCEWIARSMQRLPLDLLFTFCSSSEQRFGSNQGKKLKVLKIESPTMKTRKQQRKKSNEQTILTQIPKQPKQVTAGSNLQPQEAFGEFEDDPTWRLRVNAPVSVHSMHVLRS